MEIDATNLCHYELNQRIKSANCDVNIINCLGQRFLAAGGERNKINIFGTPGNALGAYMNGAEIIVNGNVGDAVGDTMNDGKIIVHGNAGDALGYSMRGGKIFIRGNSGYRTGIHMKQYQDKKPLIIIGGQTGSFLGEYLAGGVIMVLNLNCEKAVYEFTGTGMHGGKIIFRQNDVPKSYSPQVSISKAEGKDLDEIRLQVSEFCQVFSLNYNSVIDSDFYILRTNNNSPFKQHYTIN